MLKKQVISFIILLSVLLSGSTAMAAPDTDGMKGVWVASVYNIDYPSSKGLSAEQLKAEADEVLDNVASMKLNAVFFQVRPAADALYRSSYFPWSSYVSGTTGQAPPDDFDVLQYWVTAAHSRGLELHAWINPYRAAVSKDDLEALPDSSPVKMHPDWVKEYKGKYYFDPGVPSVQQLVIKGAEEIAQNYDVDGIHLDDYFYPAPDFNDADTYARFKGDYDDLDDWRRNNVNTLIKALDKSLHNIKPDISFGVSPFGIWDNRADNSKGSDTNGQSSYRELYCDSLEWINSGTVDYICPQLYWELGNTAADFEVLAEWWQDAVSKSDVALYIGMGAYRSEEASAGNVWYGTSEISRQLDFIEKSRDIQGEVFFSYSSLMNVSGYPELLSGHYSEGGSADDDKPGEPDKQPEPNVPEGKKEEGILDIISIFLTKMFC